MGIKNPFKKMVVSANGAISDPSRLCFFLKPCCVCGQSWGGVGMFSFLNLHTSWTLRNCVILVHTNMFDATHLVQINMPVSFLSNMLDTTPVTGWGGDVNVLRTCTHPGCYATVLFLCAQYMLDATHLVQINMPVSFLSNMRFGAKNLLKKNKNLGFTKQCKYQ